MRSSSLIAVAVILAVSLIIPLSFASSDSISESDVSLTIGGMDVDPKVSEVDISLANGGDRTLTIYVVNKSADRISVYTDSVKSADGEIRVFQTTTDPVVIDPYRSGSSKDIAPLNVKITADLYADSSPRALNLVFHVQDLDTNEFITLSIRLNVDVNSSFDQGDAFNKFFGIIPNTLDGSLGQPWFAALVTLVTLVFLAWVVCKTLIPMLIGMSYQDKGSKELKKMIRTVTAMFTLIVALLTVTLCIFILGSDSTTTHYFMMVSSVIYVIAGAMLSWTLYKIVVLRLIGRIEKNVDKTDSSLVPLFKMIGRLIITVAAVVIILAFFGVDLAGIMVSAGVVSLGITLGAQSVLNQFFSGIVILSTRPFKKGDFLKINGEVYIVTKVKLMYTEFTNWGKDQIVTMPNNAVASATLVNLTRGSAVARILVFVSVAYDANMTKVKEILIKAAEMHPHVIKDGSYSRPTTTMTEWLDSGVQYRLACYVDDFDDSPKYAGQLREMIFTMFKDSGIEIPYSRVQVDLLSMGQDFKETIFEEESGKGKK